MKTSETCGFLMFSVVTERDDWYEISWLCQIYEEMCFSDLFSFTGRVTSNEHDKTIPVRSVHRKPFGRISCPDNVAGVQGFARFCVFVFWKCLIVKCRFNGLFEDVLRTLPDIIGGAFIFEISPTIYV